MRGQSQGFGQFKQLFLFVAIKEQTIQIPKIMICESVLSTGQ